MGMDRKLLIVSYPHVDSTAFEQTDHLLDVGIGIMIREEHFGPDGLCGFGALLGRHRVRLVGGEESDVDIFEARHLRNILRIATDIDAESVEREDETIVAALGMEFEMFRSRIIGQNSLNGHAIAELQFVAIVHHPTLPDNLGAVLVGDNHGRGLFQLPYSHGVAMVEMLMGDEDEVGLGQLGIIRLRLQFRDGVHLYLLTVVVDSDATVLDGGEGDFLAALGLERISLLAHCVLATCRQRDGRQHEQQC